MSSERAPEFPISGLLTVIITTSPTPSAPSTELLSTILQSFKQHCAGLLSCRVVVVFDHYDQIEPQARLKKGHVTVEQARDYNCYKANVKRLVLQEFRHGREPQDRVVTEGQGEAEYGSPKIAANSVPFTVTKTEDKSVIFIEPARRLGFGLAVRSALRMTETPHVWVQQHDWALLQDIPIKPLLEVMKASETADHAPVKYVCLPAIRMLAYATSADVNNFPLLKQLTASLKRDFLADSLSETKIPLTPMFFWHDKPHIASTEHYLMRVFPTRLAMLRGDFIEDKIGQRARAQMKEGHFLKWATWLYYPADGKQLCLRHLKGRTFRGESAESEKITEYRDRNHQEKEPTRT